MRAAAGLGFDALAAGAGALAPLLVWAADHASGLSLGAGLLAFLLWLRRLRAWAAAAD